MKCVVCPLCHADFDTRELLREHFSLSHPDFDTGWWINSGKQQAVPKIQSLEREKLFKLHRDTCNKALELMKKKNEDYSKSDPYDNLMVCEALKITSAENGILIRMGDKLSRLASVLEKGALVNESIDDSVIDLVNYSVLLLGLRMRRK